MVSTTQATQPTPSPPDTQAPHLSRAHLRFRRIVAATDFSSPAQCALHNAAVLARQFGSELFLVHAASPFLYSTADQVVPYEILEHNLNDIKAQLGQILRDDAAFRDLAPSSFVAYGDPVEMVCQVATDVAADLIIVGSHGASGLERLALGSVAECILRKSKCPVLIVGPRCKPQADLLRSIVFATDFKSTGLPAAQYATGLAEYSHGKLTSLHVIDHASGRSAEEQACLHGRAMHALTTLLPESFPEGCTASLKVEFGVPAQTIDLVARRESATLIVLGLKEGWGLEDHSPRSTLPLVVREAECPVLGVGSHIIAPSR